MKILFACANYTYPPMEGMHLQFTLLLKQMQKLGHECFLVAYVRDGYIFDQERFARDCPGIKVCGVIPTRSGYSSLGVKNLLRNVLPRGLMPQLGAFVRIIRSVCVQQSIDVIHLEGIPLAPDVPMLKPMPVLFSTVDAWSLRQWRVMQRTSRLLSKMFRLGGYGFSRMLEQKYFPRADAVHVVSEEDADYLRKFLPNQGVVTIPVSMDSRLEHVKLQDLPPNECGLMLFSGDIRVDYIRDGLVWFLEQVWPKLQATQLRLRVLGRAAPDAELAKIASACGAVEFIDWVDDFDAELSKASVIVLPDQTGTGLKNRLIHALALARPVVATSVVAEGIPVQSGGQMMIADVAEAFAAAVDRILCDKDFGASLGAMGRERMLELYAPARVAAQWDRCYRSIVTK